MTSGRLVTLTQMRFFAALYVVLHHTWIPFTGPWGVPGSDGPLAFGFLAVGFFFVLSGVVLAWSWTPGTPATLQWRRRLARILPLHWLTLCATALLLLLDPAIRSPGTHTLSAFWSQFTLTQSWPPYKSLAAFNAPSWSLSVELFFYLLFPLVIPLVAQLRRPMLLVAGCTATVLYLAAFAVIPAFHLYALGRDPLMSFPPVQFAKFFIGVCIGCALRAGWRPQIKVAHAAGLLAALVLGLGLLTAWPRSIPVGRHVADIDEITLLSIFALIVAGACRDLDRGRRSRQSLRWLTRLGEESFALYLVHYPIFLATISIRVRTNHLADPPGLLWLGVYVVSCIGCAHLLHRRVERPLERRLRGTVHRRPPVTARHPVALASPLPSREGANGRREHSADLGTGGGVRAVS